MQRKPLPRLWQKPVHALLILLGWLVFAGFWWHVLATQRIDPRDVFLLIAGSLLIVPAVTLSWVVHNRNIHRRKGPRTRVRQVEEAYAQDWAGSPIHADWAALKRARVVTIQVDGAGKHFRG
jgi:hypothetical protein